MRGVLLDIDGVLHVGDTPVPGAPEAVGRLRAAGVPLRFLTNTTSRPRRSVVARLVGMGIEASEDLVLTPAVAAGDWMRAHGVRNPALFVPGATAEELADLEPLPVDRSSGAGAVVVGELGEGWDFATLNRAFRLLMDDPAAPLVALGLTRYWRATDGLRLDAGAFVRALEYAAGRTAVVMGKPDPAFFLAGVHALGLEPDEVVMVGDDVRTDVGAGQRAGLAGVLVRTGKFAPDDLTGDVAPDAVLGSVADLPDWLAG